MKKWLIILCLNGYSLYGQASPQQLPSTIQAVTVYSDRALITRHAEVELGAGEHELVFENLPAQLDNDSLQVAASATVAATILDVTSTQVSLNNSANERLQKLDQQLTDLKDQWATLKDQQKVITNQLEFIHNMQTSSTQISDKTKRPTADQLQQILDLSTSSMQALLTEQRQLDYQKQEIREKLRLLNQQRGPIQRERNLKVKHVTVKVQMVKAGNLKLNLNYLTYGASWSPFYDVRLNSQQQQLNLSYKANVMQQTGEDWQQVKLFLSTAHPALGGNAPKLPNWKLTLDNKKEETDLSITESQKSHYKSVMAPARMLARTLENNFQPATIQAVTINTNAISSTFKISQPISLISGTNQQQVTIATIDHLKADLLYKIVPRLRPTAYLQANMINNTEYPLLAGNLTIFMDDNFIAKSQLKTTMPHEPFTLDLGADEGIAVTFKQLKSFTEKTGFTNNNERITYQYEITAKNNKNYPVTIQVNDHIPVSQSDKIKVKLLTPTDIEPDKQGKLTWQSTLNPAQKQLIPLSFSVEYPASTQLKGL